MCLRGIRWADAHHVEGLHGAGESLERQGSDGLTLECLLDRGMNPRCYENLATGRLV
jgi:hypothetical protein